MERKLVKFLEMKMPELINGGISNITKKWLDLRQKDGETEITLNNALYHKGGIFGKNQDFLELTFFAKSTYGGTSFVAAVDTPEAPNGYYVLVLRFYNVKPFLTKEVLNGGYAQIETALHQIFQSCDVRLYSDDPSWFYQGGWEAADKHDVSIFKFTGPNGTGKWDAIHTESGGLTNPPIHITKHLAQVLMTLSDYVPEIAQNLEVK